MNDYDRFFSPLSFLLFMKALIYMCCLNGQSFLCRVRALNSIFVFVKLFSSSHSDYIIKNKLAQNNYNKFFSRSILN